MPSLWIPARLPGLNEIIALASRYGRKPTARKSGSQLRRARWSAYNDAKVEWESFIATIVRVNGFDVPPGCWRYTYVFVEPNRKRDPSNMLAAIKFIEDAFRGAGVLENDGWAQVQSGCWYRATAKDLGIKRGVLVHVGGEHLTEAEALQKAKDIGRDFNRRELTFDRNLRRIGGAQALRG